MQMDVAGFLKFLDGMKEFNLWQIPRLYFGKINASGQEGVTGMALLPQPADQLHQRTLRHRRATGGRPHLAAADVKKNRAPLVRLWRIGIVPNLDQPAIGKILMAHLFFRKPGWGMLRVVDRDKTIIVRTGGVIDPGVGFGHLMKGKFRTRRERRIVGVDFADAKDAGRRATVPLLFAQAVFILTGEAATPGQTVLAEQDRNRPADGVR